MVLLKYSVGDRVLLYTGSASVRAKVVGATRDEVTIQLWPNGRVITLEGFDDISRLSRDRGYRRRS